MKKNGAFIVGASVFIVSMLFYLPSLAVAPLAGDPAIFATRSELLLLDSFAQTHSMFLLAGHILARATGLSTVIVLGLIAAICGGLTLSMLTVLVNSLGGGARGGIAAAAALLVAHTMWMHAVMPEVYTLNLLFLILILICAYEWLKRDTMIWLASIAFLGAWGSLNHLLAGMNAAFVLGWAFLIAMRRGIKLSHWLQATIAGMIGLLPLANLFFNDVGIHGLRRSATLFFTGGSGVTGEEIKQYGGAMFGLVGARSYLWQFLACLMALFYNFIGPQLILASRGALTFWRRTRPIMILLTGLFIINFIFAATYAINEFWAFLLPCWLVVAIWVGLGTGARPSLSLGTWTVNFDGWRWPILAALIVLMPICAYRLAVFVVERTTTLPVLEAKRAVGQVVAEKDYYGFYLWPPKRNPSLAEARWIDMIETAASNGAVIAVRPAYYNLLMHANLTENRFSGNTITGLKGSELKRHLQFGRQVLMVHPDDFASTGLADAGYRLEQLGPGYLIVIDR